MSDRFNDSEASREALSAMADGEAPAGEVARACAAWKEGAEARAAWHTYHLIGDVMRSDDLAQAGSTSAFLKNFRERLAQEPVVLVPAAAAAQKNAAAVAVAARQSGESSFAGSSAQASGGYQPVTLKRRAWLGPASVAAGFVMVVGALVSSVGVQSGGPGPAGGNMSIAQVQEQVQSGGAVPELALGLASGQQAASTFVPLTEPVKAAGVSSGPSFSRPENVYVIVVRDPRVDQMLSAAAHGAPGADLSLPLQGTQVHQVVFEPR